MSNDKKQPAVRTGTFGLAAMVAVAAVSAVGASGAWAAEETSALRVVKDPVTGKLRAPTAEEAGALDATAAKSSSGSASRGLRTGRINPAPILHPDGSVEHELTDDSLVYTVARRNPDGSISWVCVTGPEAAKAALSDKTASAAGSEHRHDR